MKNFNNFDNLDKKILNNEIFNLKIDNSFFQKTLIPFIIVLLRTKFIYKKNYLIDIDSNCDNIVLFKPSEKLLDNFSFNLKDDHFTTVDINVSYLKNDCPFSLNIKIKKNYFLLFDINNKIKDKSYDIIYDNFDPSELNQTLNLLIKFNNFTLEIFDTNFIKFLNNLYEITNSNLEYVFHLHNFKYNDNNFELDFIEFLYNNNDPYIKNNFRRRTFRTIRYNDKKSTNSIFYKNKFLQSIYNTDFNLLEMMYKKHKHYDLLLDLLMKLKKQNLNKLFYDFKINGSGFITNTEYLSCFLYNHNLFYISKIYLCKNIFNPFFNYFLNYLEFINKLKFIKIKIESTLLVDSNNDN
jgi:hypothetical protein